VRVPCIINTKQSNNKEDQDSRNPDSTDWETMQKCYMTNCGTDRHLDELSTDASDALIGSPSWWHMCNLWSSWCCRFQVIGFLPRSSSLAGME
jgi:hypothetical protein